LRQEKGRKKGTELFIRKIFQSIPLRYVETDIPNSLRLSKEIKMYAYDAYLLDCAIRYRSPLLTLDIK
jgi:hypothetical protein